jgi:transcriptional repressor NrdR
MNCPYCGGDSQVVDSRTASEGVRRRRLCDECKRRFTTYEKIAPPSIKVIKRNGKAEPFDFEKLTRSVGRVCRDRPGLGKPAIARIARAIEAQLLDERLKSIRSGELVARVLDMLRDVDRVAHNRLAANYLDEDGQLRTERKPQTAGVPGQLALFGEDEKDPDE